nr:hypothetical protein [Evansella caseinilytica]
MSHSSLGSCELSHCVIARDGTWIDITVQYWQRKRQARSHCPDIFL